MANRLLAIDPGEKFVGLSIWWGWDNVNVQVYDDPWAAVAWIWESIEAGRWDEVVIEQWRNFDAQVTWSECRTVEVIGAVEGMCRRHKVPVHRQPSTILRPGLARMSAHGIEFADMSHIRVKDRNHARSASIHGAWHLIERHRPTRSEPKLDI